MPIARERPRRPVEKSIKRHVRRPTRSSRREVSIDDYRPSSGITYLFRKGSKWVKKNKLLIDVVAVAAVAAVVAGVTLYRLDRSECKALRGSIRRLVRDRGADITQLPPLNSVADIYQTVTGSPMKEDIHQYINDLLVSPPGSGGNTPVQLFQNTREFSMLTQEDIIEGTYFRPPSQSMLGKAVGAQNDDLQEIINKSAEFVLVAYTQRVDNLLERYEQKYEGIQDQDEINVAGINVSIAGMLWSQRDNLVKRIGLAMDGRGQDEERGIFWDELQTTARSRNTRESLQRWTTPCFNDQMIQQIATFLDNPETDPVNLLECWLNI